MTDIREEDDNTADVASDENECPCGGDCYEDDDDDFVCDTEGCSCREATD